MSASSNYSIEHTKRIFAPQGHYLARPATTVQKIGVIGGGTAGYLTALGLRRMFPEVAVTVVASSKIPVIGVGEATTPLLPKYLHGFLGLDVVDFYEKVMPTWKLGIKFIWGKPGEYYFNYPFQPGSLVQSYVYHGHVNSVSWQSRLMSIDKTPICKAPSGDVHSYLPYAGYAYHLENKRFVSYLEEQLANFGVELLDRTIVDADVGDDGLLSGLVVEEGGRLEYDLYVDCTGFRSMLLEKLGAKFVDYKASLPTNQALIAKVPNNGFIKPYTTARTMKHGWCWVIPHGGVDHLGYVHCSDFCSADDAEQELREAFPTVGDDVAMVRFRSGRRDGFWRGNVVGIGNSYGFVEPLESTAIHVIIEEINLLLGNFPESIGSQPSVERQLNQRVNDRWDQLRGFLAIHYKFNGRLDTEFWRFCRDEVDLAHAQKYVDCFVEQAPLSARQHRLWERPELFDDVGYDTLLLGQGVEPRTIMKPGESRESWETRFAEGEQILATAMSHSEALEYLASHPEELRATASVNSANNTSASGLLEHLLPRP